MFKRGKLWSILVVLVFLLQSVVLPDSIACENKNVILDSSIPMITLKVFTTTESTVELVWTSDKNKVHAVSYDIFRNNNLIKSIDNFTYNDTDLTPETSYNYIIKAKDFNGKTIAESNVLNISTLAKSIETYDSSETLTKLKITDTSVLPSFNTGSSILESVQNAVYQDNYKLNTIDLDFEADRFIVKYKNEQGLEKIKQAYDKYGLKNRKSKNKNNKNLAVILLGQKKKLKDVMEDLKNKKLDSEIEYIQPDYELSLSSNDPLYITQWGLENSQTEEVIYDSIPMEQKMDMLPPHLRDAIKDSPDLKDFLMNTPPEELRTRLEAGDAPGGVPTELQMELAHDRVFMDMGYNTTSRPAYLYDAGVPGAWDVTTGSGATIAVIDTGIDIIHEDLVENIWLNTGEIPGNGIDDDENGYIDDVNGWNFVDDTSKVSVQEAVYSENHGTRIAGIIAAIKDNGKGIAGVAPSTKVIPLKVFKNGKANTSDIIDAIKYAECKGVKIINCSWGSTAYNPALKEVIQNSDILFVCAAGNDGINIDINPVYPASFDCPNIITVASFNQMGRLSVFSNFGENTVDVVAPGDEIQSTLPGNAYSQSGGTSMAAAFVTGEAALLAGCESSLGIIDIKQRIIVSSEKYSSLINSVYQGRKMNCTNALNKIYPEEIIEIIVSNNTTDVNEKSGNTGGDIVLFSTPTVEGKFVQVAGGYSHSLALKSDGTLWASGQNSSGQLGDGTWLNKCAPIQVSGLTGITAIAAGQSHSLALMNDGTISSWGSDYYGQLGDGGTTTTSKNTAVQVSGLSGIIAITAGQSHSLALKNDGTVWAWGDNTYGQLGDGTMTKKTSAVQVSGLSGITAIAGGYYHSLALKNDGTVWAWGYNNYSQLGDGTTINSAIPIQLGGLSGITAIAGGYYHSLVLKNDGTVWAWGYNNCGQLGDGTTTNRKVAVQVRGLNGITNIAAGNLHSIALKNDGTVWAWGFNSNCQLGDGTTTNREIAVQLSNLSEITAISGGNGHNLALKNDGTVWTWGYNFYGQLGDGTTIIRAEAVKASGVSEITTLMKGDSYNLVLKNDGTVWTWGNNRYGQLGDSTMILRSTAVQAIGLSEIVALGGGAYHSLALKNDNTVWTWGYNYDGQLGDGTRTTRTTAVQINALNGITSVSGGSYYSLALKNDGSVWAWGNNDYGQLGDGTITRRITPIQVSGLSGIIAIAAGNLHSLVLKNDGTVWAWGRNNYGQLGDGTTIQRTTPVQVSGLSGITAIAAGNNYNLALKNDGTVWAWGDNSYGKLGDGTMTNKITPVQTISLSGITAIAGGFYHSLALKNDGTVWAWGDNSYGKLGDGTTTKSLTPVQTIGLSGITAIAAGGNHSIALKNDGTVWAWGNNADGQIGNGEKGYSEYPKWSFGTPVNQTLVVTADQSNRDWGNTDILVNLIYADNNGSGISTKQYAWSTVTAAPQTWIDYTSSVTQTNEGIWYLHYKAGDNAGNSTIGYFGPYKLDKTVSGVSADIESRDWGNTNVAVVLTYTDTGESGVSAKQYAWSTGTATPETWIDYTSSVMQTNEGIWYLHYRAVDNAGNVRIGYFGPYKIDKTVPGVSADIESKDWGNTDVAVILTYIDAGGSGVSAKQYAWSIDISTPVTWTGYSSKVYKVSEGIWYLHYKAIDNAGNIRTGYFGPYKIDKTMPGVSADCETRLSRNTDVTVALTYADDGSGVNTRQYSWSSNRATPGTWTDYNTPVTQTAEGIWFLHYKTTDNSGNSKSGHVGCYTIDKTTPLVDEQFIQVSAGYYHSLALRDDGTVLAWGDNFSGQLGDGTTIKSTIPIQVSELRGIIDIEVGRVHNLALRYDGTVWAWGQNSDGELGDNTTISRTIPFQISQLSGITAVAAGANHSLALRNDGTVWVWGDNRYGQLGNGTTIDSSTPVQVSGLSGIIAIAGGYYHNLALMNDGTVWTWGNELWGARTRPVQVSGLSGVIAIAGGYYRSFALKNDGTVWARGLNTGESGGEIDRTTYAQVIGLSEITAITAGCVHNLALKNDGTVWAWGDNTYGQLGDGTTTDRYTTVQQVSGVSGVSKISGGEHHSLALKSDGTVLGWGCNSDSQLGIGEMDYWEYPYWILGTQGTESITVTADTESRDWESTDISVNLLYLNIIGVNSKQYAWSTDTTIPEAWTEYIGPVTQINKGIWYLHYRAVDTIGNVTIGYFGPYKLYKPILYEYHYDLNNRLDQITRDGVPFIKFDYDDNGNLISKQLLP